MLERILSGAIAFVVIATISTIAVVITWLAIVTWLLWMTAGGVRDARQSQKKTEQVQTEMLNRIERIEKSAERIEESTSPLPGLGPP